jgi:hypothetical protein
MKMKQEMKRYARKVKGKLATVFAPEHLEALARQSDFIQRSSSKLTGKDFVELMTTEMIEEPAVSLEGLCDLLAACRREHGSVLSGPTFAPKLAEIRA